jgi:hypothetical protein
MSSKSAYNFKPIKIKKKLLSSKSLKKTLNNNNISHNTKIIHIKSYTTILKAYHDNIQNKKKKKELMKKIQEYENKIKNLQYVMKIYPDKIVKNESNTTYEYEPKAKKQEIENKLEQFQDYKRNRDSKLTKKQNRVIEIIHSKTKKQQYKLSNAITIANIQKELELLYLKHPELNPKNKKQLIPK